MAIHSTIPAWEISWTRGDSHPYLSRKPAPKKLGTSSQSLLYPQYLFIYDYTGSWFLCGGFLQLRRAGASLVSSMDSRCVGFSSWGSWALRCGLSRHVGLVSPWHVGSSQIRDRTHIPCIGRQILNHQTTREAQSSRLWTAGLSAPKKATVFLKQNSGLGIRKLEFLSRPS